MKDYRIPMAVAVPAAIGLCGILWILRRKSGSGKGEKRPPASCAIQEDRHVLEEADRVLGEQVTQSGEKEGVTITQRKIPESQARDRGSSDINRQSPEQTANALSLASTRADTADRQTGGLKDSIDKPKENHCGQTDGLTSSQRVQVEKLITSAMGDGLLEAQVRLCEMTPRGDAPCRMDTSQGDAKSSVDTTRGDASCSIITSQGSAPCSVDTPQGDAPCSIDTPQGDAPCSVDRLEGVKVVQEAIIQQIGSFQCEPAAVNSSETVEKGADLRVPSTAASENVENRKIELGLQGDRVEEGEEEVEKTVITATDMSTLRSTAIPVSEGKNNATDTSSQSSHSQSADTDSNTAVLIGQQKAHDTSPSTSSSVSHLVSRDVQIDNTVNQNDSTTAKGRLQPAGQGNTVPSKDTGTIKEARGDSVSESHTVEVSSSFKRLPCDRYGARASASPCSRLPLTSTSSIESISSLSAEEIESIWGIVSAPEASLDTSQSVVDTSTASVLSSDTNSSLGKQFSGQLSSASAPIQSSVVGRDIATDSQHRGVVNSSEVAHPRSSTDLKEGSPTKSSSPVCDNNSEGSNDSGRGGSEHDTVCQGSESMVYFDFNMPSDLCGRFIGKQGKNINYLKSKTGANISLSNNPFTAEYQICQIAGTQAEVDDALAMIRRKFPIQEYPMLTMIPVNMSPASSQLDHPFVVPDVMQLSLPEGVSVEVYVSAIVDAGQVFVQQPTHRSFMSLEKLNYFLNAVYAQDPNVPCVPTPVECGVICVCENEGFWYRAMITSQEDENGEAQVKFVDYGGYAQMPVSALKQIRTDFMSLPFQAVECFMANITPNQDEQYFSPESTLALSEMTQNKLLQCQVVARSENGIPYIHLYQVSPENNSAVMINRALVNSRLVRWIEIL